VTVVTARRLSCARSGHGALAGRLQAIGYLPEPCGEQGLDRRPGGPSQRRFLPEPVRRRAELTAY
jgi:hypothetical protein